MKALHLIPTHELKPPFTKMIEEMLTVEREHSVIFENGGIGYIIGEMVIAPFFFKESCIVTKDNQKIVLTYKSTSQWGVSYFQLPFKIVCEPLRFRREHIHSDSFFFKVSDDVQLCKGANITKSRGRFEVSVPADFCPVFDRHAHLLGFNIGLLHNTWLMVKIQELL